MLQTSFVRCDENFRPRRLITRREVAAKPDEHSGVSQREWNWGQSVVDEGDCESAASAKKRSRAIFILNKGTFDRNPKIVCRDWNWSHRKRHRYWNVRIIELIEEGDVTIGIREKRNERNVHCKSIRIPATSGEAEGA